jgi:hypothetical protein
MYFIDKKREFVNSRRRLGIREFHLRMRLAAGPTYKGRERRSGLATTKLAARVLLNPNYGEVEKSLAGSVLSQAAPKFLRGRNGNKKMARISQLKLLIKRRRTNLKNGSLGDFLFFP